MLLEALDLFKSSKIEINNDNNNKKYLLRVLYFIGIESKQNILLDYFSSLF